MERLCSLPAPAVFLIFICIPVGFRDTLVQMPGLAHPATEEGRGLRAGDRQVRAFWDGQGQGMLWVKLL